MPKQIRLTRKRLEWAQPRAATLKGTRLPPYSAAASAKYQASLDRLVQQMQKEYNAEVRKLFRQHADEESALAMDSINNYCAFVGALDASLASQARILFSWLGQKYAKLFASRATGMTERMIDSSSMASKRALGESLKKISGGITIPVPDMPGLLSEKLTAATAENVGLIKSISQQYHERISQLVLRSVSTGGNGAQDIFEGIRHYDGLTENRAKLIAVDQTRKVTTAMNVERAKSVGMRRWEWVHSSGSAQPRKLHVQYDGQIFSYDSPPIIDDSTGERGFPGQLINCRCTMAPVLELGDAEDVQ
jgi:SPP1 gp7 family putative phage head morphogenesis protein